MKDKKIEPFKLPFPGYKYGEINSVILVIEDISIYDDTKEKNVVDKPKTKEQADEFLIMINGLCKTSGFYIDAAGPKEAMLERFNKVKNESSIYNQALSDVLDLLEKSPGVHITRIPEKILRLKK